MKSNIFVICTNFTWHHLKLSYRSLPQKAYFSLRMVSKNLQFTKLPCWLTCPLFPVPGKCLRICSRQSPTYTHTMRQENMRPSPCPMSTLLSQPPVSCPWIRATDSSWVSQLLSWSLNVHSLFHSWSKPPEMPHSESNSESNLHPSLRGFVAHVSPSLLNIIFLYAPSMHIFLVSEMLLLSSFTKLRNGLNLGVTWGEWIMKMWVCTQRNIIQPFKRNKSQPLVAIWIELENILRTAASQLQEDKYYMLSLTHRSVKKLILEK